MEEVKLEEAVCPTCLTHGRAMIPLRRAARAYHMLLVGIHTDAQIEEFVTFSRVCWECHHFLARVLRFQNQVLHANMMLQSYNESMKNMSYSFLGNAKKIGFDYELQDPDIDDIPWDIAVSPESTLAQVKIELESNRTKELILTDVALTKEAVTPIEAETKEKKRKTTRKRKKKDSERDSRIITMTLSEMEMMKYRDEDRENEQYVKAPYKCETCIKGFLFPDLLERHNQAKHNVESGPHQCPVCRECFASEEPLAKHRRKHYALHKCAQCGYTGRTLPDVERHFAGAHEPAQALLCSECDQIFATKRKLRYHKESAHKEAVKCELCGKVMINRYSLKHHMLTHTGMPTYECNICHKVYRGEAGLYSHMRLFHSSESAADTYCAQCDIQFKNKTIYRSHLKRSPRHATPEQLKYPCEKCPKRFISEASLRKHDRYYHLDYTCQICQKRLKNWFSLDNHVKFVHEGREMPRKHMCETCGKGFKTKTMLNNHLTTHTGERPHTCDICGAAFSVKASLRTHRRHVHFKMAKPAAAPQYAHY